MTLIGYCSEPGIEDFMLSNAIYQALDAVTAPLVTIATGRCQTAVMMHCNYLGTRLQLECTWISRTVFVDWTASTVCTLYLFVKPFVKKDKS